MQGVADCLSVVTHITLAGQIVTLHHPTTHMYYAAACYFVLTSQNVRTAAGAAYADHIRVSINVSS
jgi:hypothetical protein